MRIGAIRPGALSLPRTGNRIKAYPQTASLSGPRYHDCALSPKGDLHRKR